MTLTMPVPTGSPLFPLTPLFFAQHTTRELDDDDFDEDEYDDFDDFRSKHPRRRPFLKFALILLLIAGVWYVVANSNMPSSILKRVTGAIGAIFNPGFTDLSLQSDHGTDSALLSQAVPLPAFHEGQHVVITLTGEPHARLQLSHDTGGTQPGPSVQTGDVLTIIDGRLINHQWLYFVQTQSEHSGWIPEESLRAQF